MTIIEHDAAGRARRSAVLADAHPDARTRDVDAESVVERDVVFERRDRAVDVIAVAAELDDVARGAFDRADLVARARRLAARSRLPHGRADRAEDVARGVGLFDTTASQITSSTLPYDALVYGSDNNHLFDPTGALAPTVDAAPEHGTYVRTSHWTTQLVATPGICEVR